MGRRPTSFDIAQLAGVSQPTVSRALRGSPAVNEQTRLRIEAIAQQLNYAVDKNASSLRRQQSNTLALLFFEDPAPGDSMINPFFLAMLGSITRTTARAGYDLLISFQQLSGDWHTDYQDSHKADGIILLGYGDYDLYRARLAHLVEQGTHFVRWGSLLGDGLGLTLGSDNHGGGLAATRHLIGRGRRTIGFLGTNSSQAPEFRDRWRGYAEALDEAGIGADPLLQRNAVSAEAAGQAAMRSLLAQRPDIDAVFAASDLIAIGAMRALVEAGRTIPGDVAVIGFDDIPAASLTAPPLTTVMQDVRGAGEALVDALLRQIRGERITGYALPTQLIVRASVG